MGDSGVSTHNVFETYIKTTQYEDYIETLGVCFGEKEVKLKNVDVTISVWYLGSQKEFATLIPLVVVDSQCMIFCFDLTCQASLFSVKRWYKEAKKENKKFVSFLVGTKFELFESMDDEFKKEITKQARKFAERMNATLIYCSSKQNINIKTIFHIIISKVFDIKPKKIQQQTDYKKGPILDLSPFYSVRKNEYELVKCVLAVRYDQTIKIDM